MVILGDILVFIVKRKKMKKNLIEYRFAVIRVCLIVETDEKEKMIKNKLKKQS